jgi:SNF2 family DNA or RNA helicase
VKTYGTLRLARVGHPPRQHWCIEADPQVVVRLKRVFARIAVESNELRLHVYVAKTRNPAQELERVRRRHPLFSPDVYLLNYHKLAGWAGYLAGRVKSCVFDEAQELRRPDSEKYRAATKVAAAAAYKLECSATPVYNYGAEIYHVLDVIAPDALGTPDEFSREWCGWGEKVKEPRALGAHLRDAGLMLRRTRAEVGRELPSLQVIPHEIDADLSVLEKVENAADELAHIILTQQGLERGAKLRASEELSWMLRQATGIAKARFSADFVRMLVDSGERVLLYGWHRDVYGIWAERLKDLKPAFYTGGETERQKATSMERFVKGETPVLAMSLRAGQGIDGLQQHCRTVVIAELDWSPGVHSQCIGRVHRDGQPDPVVAYFLVADSGSDPVVADVLGLKRRQSEAIRDPKADLIETLEIDEGHVRRLAEAHLARKGGAVPAGV